MPRLPETTHEMLQILSVRPTKINSSVTSVPYARPFPFPFLPIPSRQHPPTSCCLFTLPLEILTTFLLALDFDTLGCLRLTYLTFNLAISNLKEFQLITRYTFAVLRTLKIPNFLSYHSIAKIHIGLITPTCFICGHFGPYFSIFHGERVCYPVYSLIPPSDSYSAASQNGTWISQTPTPVAASCKHQNLHQPFTTAYISGNLKGLSVSKERRRKR